MAYNVRVMDKSGVLVNYGGIVTRASAERRAILAAAEFPNCVILITFAGEVAKP